MIREKLEYSGIAEKLCKAMTEQFHKSSLFNFLAGEDLNLIKSFADIYPKASPENATQLHYDSLGKIIRADENKNVFTKSVFVIYVERKDIEDFKMHYYKFKSLKEFL
jgi:hypothetical protein